MLPDAASDREVALRQVLPELLEPDGVAYVMQLSIMSQVQTAELLGTLGLGARVIDFGFFPFTEAFERNRAQIGHVEELSDAYHLGLGDTDMMVAYLLEVGRRGA